MDSGRRLEFGIGMPQVEPSARFDTQRLHRFLVRAEELGFDSVWVLEQPVGAAAVLEPLTLLAHAAAVTSRIRLGTAVILTPLRIPVQLAKALATLDQLSGGRLIAGLALGGWRDLFPAFGLSPEHRARRFEEAVRLIDRLWTEDAVTFDGEFWQMTDVRVEPKPVQRPRPPVWFGGHVPKAIERAVRMADGWIGAGSADTEAFATAHQGLQGALRLAGRDTATFQVAKRVYVAVDDDAGRARTRLREWFGLFYGNPDLADDVAVWGSAEACVEGLADVVRAGATTIVLNPVFDQQEQAEALAADVIPALVDL
jgi:probable F420-dependent oxidoreductase